MGRGSERGGREGRDGGEEVEGRMGTQGMGAKRGQVSGGGVGGGMQGKKEVVIHSREVAQYLSIT